MLKHRTSSNPQRDVQRDGDVQRKRSQALDHGPLDLSLLASTAKKRKLKIE
jgi:hypothetical protein